MHTPSSPFLTDSVSIPIDRPFTAGEARGEGVGRRQLGAWLESGHLVSPVHGVLHAAQLPDSLGLRVACLRLVVPQDAVITDRTAAWLHGAPMVMPAATHREVPPVDVFLPPGGRLRRPLVHSGERGLLADEIMELDGIRVTTPLRTICDLGRNLPRKPAFGAMCMMLKVTDFSTDAIRLQADERFKGFRWVCQLRSLIPYLDGRFESPGECTLALIWHDTLGLPEFVPQLAVPGPHGTFRLDLGVPELGYAAEYDGAEFHGPAQVPADRARREWLEQQGWQISVFVAEDVRGTGQIAAQRLLTEIATARRTRAARRPVL